MTSFQSIPEMFFKRVEQSSNKPAFHFPTPEGGWGSLSWNQTAERVRHIGCGLLSMGLNDEDRVSILSSTRVEWILADLGVMSAGGATTTIYPSSNAEECEFIVSDSGSTFAFVEDPSQIDRFLETESLCQ